MIRPTSVPSMIPASTTAASTRLPSPHANRAFTPNSGHYRQHTQRKFQPGERYILLNLLDAQDVKQTQRVN
eukprot:15225980-Ditylum_brightwellii.AAC.1